MSRISGFGSSSYSAIVQQAANRKASQAQKVQKTVANQLSKTSDPFAPTQGSAPSSVDNALHQVSELQDSADQMVIDLASGKDVNVHHTMVELEKADIALKYTVQLRNRALSAYEELMRIQV